MLLILTSCKENKDYSVAITEMNSVELKDDARGSIQLDFDGKNYDYDNIDWNYSRVEMNNDMLIKIVQKGMPSIDFSFPASDQHLKNGNFSYTIPSDGSPNETLYLSFFDKNRKTEKLTHKRIVLRSGQIEVQRSKNSITINFDAEGSSMGLGSKENQFPIEGTMVLKF